MPASQGIRWVVPPTALAEAIERYGERVLVAVQAVAGEVATLMQNAAKDNARWTDRTGNARSGLFGTAEAEFAQELVVIYLSHGADIDYGVYLETRYGGRYAIIMRTIEQHLPQLRRMLEELLR